MSKTINPITGLEGDEKTNKKQDNEQFKTTESNLSGLYNEEDRIGFEQVIDVPLEDYEDKIGRKVTAQDSQSELTEMVAELQSTGEQLGRAGIRFGSELALGTTKAITDVPDILRALFSEDGLASLAKEEFTNDISNALAEAQEAVRDGNQIYMKRDDAWYSVPGLLNNAEALASGVTMLLPIMGAAKGASFIMNAINKGSKALGSLAGVPLSTNKVVSSIAGAMYGNLYETGLEVQQLFPQLESTLKSRGYNDEQIRKVLGEQAKEMYINNLPAAMLDMIGVYQLMKPLNGTRDILKRIYSKNVLGAEVIPEGVQEGINFLSSETAKRNIDIYSGVSDKEYGIKEAVGDPHFWEAMTIGAISGHAFSSFGNVGRQVAENSKAIRDANIPVSDKPSMMSGVGRAFAGVSTIQDRKRIDEQKLFIKEIDNSIAKLQQLEVLADNSNDDKLRKEVSNAIDNKIAQKAFNNGTFGEYMRMFDTTLGTMSELRKKVADNRAKAVENGDTELVKKIDNDLAEWDKLIADNTNRKEKLLRYEKVFNKGLNYFGYTGELLNEYYKNQVISDDAQIEIDRLNKIKEEEDSLSDDISEEDREIRESNKPISKIVKSLQNSVSNVKSISNNLKEKINKYKENKKAKSKIQELNNEIELIEEEINKAEKESNNLKPNVTNNRGIIKVTKEQRKQAKEKLNKLKKDRDALLIEKSNIENELVAAINESEKTVNEIIENKEEISKEQKADPSSLNITDTDVDIAKEEIKKAKADKELIDIHFGDKKKQLAERRKELDKLSEKEKINKSIVTAKRNEILSRVNNEKLKNIIFAAKANGAIKLLDKMDINDIDDVKKTLKSILDSFNSGIALNDLHREILKAKIKEVRSLHADMKNNEDNYNREIDALSAGIWEIVFNAQDLNEVSKSITNKTDEELFDEIEKADIDKIIKYGKQVLDSIDENIEDIDNINEALSNISDILNAINIEEIYIESLKDKDYSNELKKLKTIGGSLAESKGKMLAKLDNSFKKQEVQYSNHYNKIRDTLKSFGITIKEDGLKGLIEAIELLKQDEEKLNSVRELFDKIDTDIVSIIEEIYDNENYAYNKKKPKINDVAKVNPLAALTLLKQDKSNYRDNYDIEALREEYKDDKNVLDIIDRVVKLNDLNELRLMVNAKISLNDVIAAEYELFKNDDIQPFPEQVLAYRKAVLYYLNGYNNALVQGVAGSGKTTMVSRRAIDIIKKLEGINNDKIISGGNTTLITDNISKNLGVAGKLIDSVESFNEAAEDNNIVVIDEIGRIDTDSITGILDSIEEINKNRKEGDKLFVFFTGDPKQTGKNISLVNSGLNISSVLTNEYRAKNQYISSYASLFKNGGSHSELVGEVVHNNDRTLGVEHTKSESDFIDIVKAKNTEAKKDNNKTKKGSLKRAIIIEDSVANSTKGKDLIARLKKEGIDLPIYNIKITEGVDNIDSIQGEEVEEAYVFVNSNVVSTSEYTAITRATKYVLHYNEKINVANETNDNIGNDSEVDSKYNEIFKNNKEEYLKRTKNEIGRLTSEDVVEPPISEQDVFYNDINLRIAKEGQEVFVINVTMDTDNGRVNYKQYLIKKDNNYLEVMLEKSDEKGEFIKHKKEYEIDSISEDNILEKKTISKIDNQGFVYDFEAEEVETTESFIKGLYNQIVNVLRNENKQLDSVDKEYEIHVVTKAIRDKYKLNNSVFKDGSKVIVFNYKLKGSDTIRHRVLSINSRKLNDKDNSISTLKGLLKSVSEIEELSGTDIKYGSNEKIEVIATKKDTGEEYNLPISKHRFFMNITEVDADGNYTGRIKGFQQVIDRIGINKINEFKKYISSQDSKVDVFKKITDATVENIEYENRDVLDKNSKTRKILNEKEAIDVIGKDLYELAKESGFVVIKIEGRTYKKGSRTKSKPTSYSLRRTFNVYGKNDTNKDNGANVFIELNLVLEGEGDGYIVGDKNVIEIRESSKIDDVTAKYEGTSRTTNIKGRVNRNIPDIKSDSNNDLLQGNTGVDVLANIDSITNNILEVINEGKNKEALGIAQKALNDISKENEYIYINGEKVSLRRASYGYGKNNNGKYDYNAVSIYTKEIKQDIRTLLEGVASTDENGVTNADKDKKKSFGIRKSINRNNNSEVNDITNYSSYPVEYKPSGLVFEDDTKQNEEVIVEKEVKAKEPTPNNDIEAKEAEIEKRRQEELDKAKKRRDNELSEIESNTKDYPKTIPVNSRGEKLYGGTSIYENAIKTANDNFEYAKEQINAKYDAELKALKEQTTASTQSTEAKKDEIERRVDQTLSTIVGSTDLFNFDKNQKGKTIRREFIPDNLGEQIFNAIHKTLKGEVEKVDKPGSNKLFRELSKKLHPDKHQDPFLKLIAEKFFKAATLAKDKGYIRVLQEIEKSFDAELQALEDQSVSTPIEVQETDDIEAKKEDVKKELEEEVKTNEYVENINDRINEINRQIKEGIYYISGTTTLIKLDENGNLEGQYYEDTDEVVDININVNRNNIEEAKKQYNNLIRNKNILTNEMSKNIIELSKKLNNQEFIDFFMELNGKYKLYQYSKSELDDISRIILILNISLSGESKDVLNDISNDIKNKLIILTSKSDIKAKKDEIEKSRQEIDDIDDIEIDDSDDDVILELTKEYAEKEVNEYDRIAVDKIRAIIKRLLPDISDKEVLFLSEAIYKQEINDKSLGAYKKGLIYLLKGSDGKIGEIVVRHEVFHKLWNQYIPIKEKNKTIEAVRNSKEYQSFLKRNKAKDNDVQIEEYMARKFQSYNLGNYSGQPSLLRKAFSTIMKAAKRLLQYFNLIPQDTLESLFKDIYNGLYQNRLFQNAGMDNLLREMKYTKKDIVGSDDVNNNDVVFNKLVKTISLNYATNKKIKNHITDEQIIEEIINGYAKRYMFAALKEHKDLSADERVELVNQSSSKKKEERYSEYKRLEDKFGISIAIGYLLINKIGLKLNENKNKNKYTYSIDKRYGKDIIDNLLGLKIKSKNNLEEVVEEESVSDEGLRSDIEDNKYFDNFNKLSAKLKAALGSIIVDETNVDSYKAMNDIDYAKDIAKKLRKSRKSVGSKKAYAIAIKLLSGNEGLSNNDIIEGLNKEIGNIGNTEERVVANFLLDLYKKEREYGTIATKNKVGEKVFKDGLISIDENTVTFRYKTNGKFKDITIPHDNNANYYKVLSNAFNSLSIDAQNVIKKTYSSYDLFNNDTFDKYLYKQAVAYKSALIVKDINHSILSQVEDQPYIMMSNVEYGQEKISFFNRNRNVKTDNRNILLDKILRTITDKKLLNNLTDKSKKAIDERLSNIENKKELKDKIKAIGLDEYIIKVPDNLVNETNNAILGIVSYLRKAIKTSDIGKPISISSLSTSIDQSLNQLDSLINNRYRGDRKTSYIDSKGNKSYLFIKGSWAKSILSALNGIDKKIIGKIKYKARAPHLVSDNYISNNLSLDIGKKKGTIKVGSMMSVDGLNSKTWKKDYNTPLSRFNESTYNAAKFLHGFVYNLGLTRASSYGLFLYPESDRASMVGSEIDINSLTKDNLLKILSDMKKMESDRNKAIEIGKVYGKKTNNFNKFGEKTYKELLSKADSNFINTMISFIENDIVKVGKTHKEFIGRIERAYDRVLELNKDFDKQLTNNQYKEITDASGKKSDLFNKEVLDKLFTLYNAHYVSNAIVGLEYNTAILGDMVIENFTNLNKLIKRNQGINSPGDALAIYDGDNIAKKKLYAPSKSTMAIFNDDKETLGIINDVKRIYSKLYNIPIEREDGTSFILPETLEEVKKGATKDLDNIFKNIVFYVDKNGQTKYIKTATFVLTDDLVKMFPELNTVRDNMRNSNTNHLIAKSAFKVGSPDAIGGLFDTIGESNVHELDYRGYRIQGNPIHEYEYSRNPSQLNYFVNVNNLNLEEAFELSRYDKILMDTNWELFVKESGIAKQIDSNGDIKELDFGKLKGILIDMLKTKSGKNRELDILMSNVNFNYPAIEKEIVSSLMSLVSKNSVEIKHPGDKVVLQTAKGIYVYDVNGTIKDHSKLSKEEKEKTNTFYQIKEEKLSKALLKAKEYYDEGINPETGEKGDISEEGLRFIANEYGVSSMANQLIEMYNKAINGDIILPRRLKMRDNNGYTEIIASTEFLKKLGYKEGDIFSSEQVSDAVKQKLLSGVGIRIPTTGIHSAIVFKIVASQDVNYNYIIAPDELIALHGSDFDVDSMFLHRRVITDEKLEYNGVSYNEGDLVGYDKDGNFNEELLSELLKIETTSETETTLKLKKYMLINKKIDLYEKVLTAEKNKEDMNAPIEFRTIKEDIFDFADEVTIEGFISSLKALSDREKKELPALFNEDLTIKEDVVEKIVNDNNNANKELVLPGNVGVINKGVSSEISKERREAIESIFNKNQELSNIGTVEQYNEYINRIFPDSKVKDIVYHGTDASFEIFDKKDIGAKTKYPKLGYIPKGFYFTKDKSVLSEWGKNIYSVILNMRNPDNITSTEFHNALDSKYIYNKKGDSAVIEGDEQNIIKAETNLKNIINSTTNSELDKNWAKNRLKVLRTDKRFLQEQFIVFEPEQIHILGGKQDIEGFKEFVSNKKEKINDKNTSDIKEQILNSSIGLTTKWKVIRGVKSLDRGGNIMNAETQSREFAKNMSSKSGVGIQANTTKVVSYSKFASPFTISNDNKSVKFDNIYNDKNSLSLSDIKSIKDIGNGKYKIEYTQGNKRKSIEGEITKKPIVFKNLTKITIDGRKYDSFQTYTKKYKRPTYFLSDTFINIYIDNVKEDAAWLFNATADTIPVISFMAEIGYDEDTIAYIMNQPIIRQFSRMNYGVLNKINNLTKNNKTYENIGDEFDITEKELMENENKDFSKLTEEEKEFQFKVLKLFSKLHTQSRVNSKNTGVSNLLKKLPTNYEELMTLLVDVEDVETVNKDPELNNGDLKEVPAIKGAVKQSYRLVKLLAKSFKIYSKDINELINELDKKLKMNGKGISNNKKFNRLERIRHEIKRMASSLFIDSYRNSDNYKGKYDENTMMTYYSIDNNTNEITKLSNKPKQGLVKTHIDNIIMHEAANIINDAKNDENNKNNKLLELLEIKTNTITNLKEVNVRNIRKSTLTDGSIEAIKDSYDSLSYHIQNELLKVAALNDSFINNDVLAQFINTGKEINIAGSETKRSIQTYANDYTKGLREVLKKYKNNPEEFTNSLAVKIIKNNVDNIDTLFLKESKDEKAKEFKNKNKYDLVIDANMYNDYSYLVETKNNLNKIYQTEEITINNKVKFLGLKNIYTFKQSDSKIYDFSNREYVVSNSENISTEDFNKISQGSTVIIKEKSESISQEDFNKDSLPSDMITKETVTDGIDTEDVIISDYHSIYRYANKFIVTKMKSYQKYNDTIYEALEEDISKNKRSISEVRKSEVLISIGETFKRRFGVEYELVGDEEWVDKGGNPDDVAFIKGDKIYINRDKASIGDAFHELGHFIVAAIRKASPQAYNNLVEEMKKLDIALYNEAVKKYGEDSAAEEALVELLARYSTRNIDVSTGMRKFFSELKKLLKTILNKLGLTKGDTTTDIELEKLLKLNINELAIVMTQLDNKVKLKTDNEILVEAKKSKKEGFGVHEEGFTTDNTKSYYEDKKGDKRMRVNSVTQQFSDMYEQNKGKELAQIITENRFKDVKEVNENEEKIITKRSYPVKETQTESEYFNEISSKVELSRTYGNYGHAFIENKIKNGDSSGKVSTELASFKQALKNSNIEEENINEIVKESEKAFSYTYVNIVKPKIANGGKIESEATVSMDMNEYDVNDGKEEYKSKGITGTIDFLIEELENVYSLYDFKTGNQSHYTDELIKYIKETDAKKYLNPKSRAMLNMIMYMIMVKNKNRDAKFNNISLISIINVPKKYDSIDDDTVYGEENRLNGLISEFLPIVERFFKENHSEWYDGNKELFDYDNLMVKGRKIQEAIESRKKEGLTSMENYDNTIKSVIQDIDDLLNTSFSSDSTPSKEDKDRLEDLLGIVSEAMFGTNTLYQERTQDMDFIQSTFYTAYDTTDPVAKIFSKFALSRKIKMNKELSDVYTDHDRLFDKMIRSRRGKGYGTFTYNAKEVYDFMWTNNNHEDRKGEWLVTWRDEKWKELSQEEKDYADYYRWMIRYRMFSSLKPKEGIKFIKEELKDRNDLSEKNIKMLEKQIDNLNKNIDFNKFSDIHQRGFKYHEGWTPRFDKQTEDEKGIMNKIKLNIRNSFMIRPDEYYKVKSGELDDTVKGIYVGMFGDRKTNAGEEQAERYTYNSQMLFKRFMLQTVKKEYLDDVYNLGLGVRTYMKDIDLYGKGGVYVNTEKHVEGLMAAIVRQEKKDDLKGRGWNRGGKFYSIDKIIRAIRNFSAISILAFRLTGGIRTLVSQSILTGQRSIANTLANKIHGANVAWTQKDTGKAFKETGKFIKSFMPFGGNPRDNKLYVIAKELGIFVDNYDYRGFSKSGLRHSKNFMGRFFNSDIAYFQYKMGDVANYAMQTVAMMEHIKIEGKSLYDWYEIEDGKAVYKGPDRGINQITGVKIKGLTNEEILYIKNTSRGLMGNMREDERVALEISTFGSMYMMFKRYMTGIINAAWMKPRESEIEGKWEMVVDKDGTKKYKWVGEYDEGYIRSMLYAGAMIFKRKGNIREFIEKDWNNMSDKQKVNTYYSLIKLASYIGLGFLISLAFGDADDEDKNKYKRFFTQLRSDIAFEYIINPTGLAKSLISVPTVDKVTNILEGLTKFGEEYQRGEYAGWNKGGIMISKELLPGMQGIQSVLGTIEDFDEIDLFSGKDI